MRKNLQLNTLSPAAGKWVGREASGGELAAESYWPGAALAIPRIDPGMIPTEQGAHDFVHKTGRLGWIRRDDGRVDAEPCCPPRVPLDPRNNFAVGSLAIAGQESCPITVIKQAG